MFYKKIAAPIFISCFLITSLAISSDSSVGAQALEVIPDARSIGMGGAYCAISDDAAGIFHNPAGLALISHTEVPFSKNQEINQVYYGFAYSLCDIGMSNIKSPGTIALSWNAFEPGTIIGRDEEGLPTFDFEAESHVFSIAYGKKILDTKAIGVVNAGITAKIYEDRLSGQKAEGEAFDAGLLWKYPKKGFFIGATVQNLGSKVSYNNEEQDLPLKATLGIAGKMLCQKLIVGIDICKPEYNDVECELGVEYRFFDTIAARIGYNSRLGRNNGIAAGTGLILKQLDILFFYLREVNIDYAYEPYDKPGDSHWVSINFKFGAD